MKIEKMIVKIVMSLSLLGAGVVVTTAVVPSGNVAYAREVLTTDASVSFDDSWLGDAGRWYDKSEYYYPYFFKTDIKLNDSGRLINSSSNDSFYVAFSSNFPTHFIYDTWDRVENKFIEKVGNFGTPFLVEDIAVDANGDGEYDVNGVDDPYVITFSKLITINDNRQYHNTISSEEITLSVNGKNGNTVTNTNDDVSVKIEWNGSETKLENYYIYNVYINGNKITGDICPIPRLGKDKVTYYAKTASGYRLVTVYVTDDSNKAAPINVFQDITSCSTEAKTAIAWLLENGITTGYNATTFAPRNTLTRAEMVTFLYRLAVKPDVAINDFPDTSGLSQEFRQAISWAKAAGITTGYGNGYFGPNDKVTREQMASFFYRLAGKPVGSFSYSFEDVSKTNEHSQAIGWLSQTGVTSGYSPSAYGPSDAVTREQMALFLKRYADKVGVYSKSIYSKVQEEQNMIWAMNQIRIAKGLPELENPADMNSWSQSRRAWVAENITHGEWVVGKPDNVSYCGENLFWGYSGIGGVLAWANEVMTASQLVEIFGQSTINNALVSLSEIPTKFDDGVTGHYDNIVNPNYNIVGVAHEHNFLGEKGITDIGIANFGKR